MFSNLILVNTKMALCTVCSVFCKTDISFQKHMKKHAEGETHFVCDECGKLFEKKQLMNDHKIKVHSRRVYSCCQCESHFKMNAHLKRHVSQVHERNSYTCDDCSKFFKIFFILI